MWLLQIKMDINLRQMSKNQLLLTSLLCAFALSLGRSQEEFSEKDRLFNGRNLKNWTVTPDKENIWWSVKDGILYAKSDAEETGSNLWSQEEYQDFLMRLEFKMGSGTVDSGVFLRGENPESPQIQIGISGSLKVDMTGSPYVPKQGYPAKAEVENLLNVKGWNTMLIKVVKNHYEVWLNGEGVLDYTLDNASLQGPVGLKLHPGRTMDIMFKEIYIKKL